MNSDQLKQLVMLAARSYNPPPAETPREAMWTRIRLARDFNRPQLRAPRESMWEKLALLRSASPAVQSGQRVRRRPAVPRIAGRDVRLPLSPRARGGRLLVSLAAFAAAALFITIRTRAVPVTGVAAAPGAVAQNSVDISLPGEFATRRNGLTSYAAAFPGRWISIALDDPVSEAYRREAITHLRRSDALISAFHSLTNDDVINRNMRTTVRELLSKTRLLLNSPASIQGQFRGVFLDLELVLVKMTLLTPVTVASDREQIETTVERSKLVPRMRVLIPVPSSSNAN